MGMSSAMWLKIYLFVNFACFAAAVENNPNVFYPLPRGPTSCGIASSANGTIITNPNYPESFPSGMNCTTQIRKYSPTVCQIRIDLADFVLMQPNGDGNCNMDYMTVTGGSSPVPNLCGENDAQHLYVNFVGNNAITIAVMTNSTVTFKRRWNLRVTQILCGSPVTAPTGCLKYFTGVSQQIESFNYGMMQNPVMTETGFPGTRELANLNYGICVRVEAGYCSIQWTQTSADLFSFTVTGDVAGSDNTILATDLGAENGVICSTDFVIIPNPRNSSGMPIGSDRFCGLGFIPITTISQPYVLTVVTDSNEDPINSSPNIANRGFSLTYTQKACT